MQHLEVSCAVRLFFKSLGFKGLLQYYQQIRPPLTQLLTVHVAQVFELRKCF